ncbi:MAG: DUF2252 family protein [Flavipsychrobacter sp.]|nr:DUF2252 family protein [Flavipsychrobacter sp.]
MVVSRIKEFNKDRVPEMLAIKYKLMADNAYRFFRGTCHLFYEDLAAAEALPASPQVWICGDLHIENYGSFTGNNRLVYFDLNDFDEAALAPASWELVRMVTSIFIAFETLKIEEKKAINMAVLFLKSYRAALQVGKANYIEPRIAKGIVSDFLKSASKRNEDRVIKKRTVKKKDKLLLMMDDPRHFEIDNFLKRELEHHVTEWIMTSPDGPYNYEVADAVFRLAGTGSVGLKRYVFLLRSIKEEEQYLLMEMKQATPSSLTPYLTTKQPNWETEAERIVAVQTRMQNVPPAMLSRTVFKNEAYIIQELQHTKDSIDFNLIKDQYRDMYQVIDDMGMLTASAQLRSSGRQGSDIADKLIAFGKNEDWQQAVIDYALNYSKKVKSDYKQYMKEYKKTKLE